jgi:hypothetical protein
MSAYKYRVRCIEAYTVEIPASVLVDQNGNELCAVPSRSIFYPYAHESGFRTAKARADFLKAAPLGKWQTV